MFPKTKIQRRAAVSKKKSTKKQRVHRKQQNPIHSCRNLDTNQSNVSLTQQQRRTLHTYIAESVKNLASTTSSQQQDQQPVILDDSTILDQTIQSQHQIQFPYDDATFFNEESISVIIQQKDTSLPPILHHFKLKDLLALNNTSTEQDNNNNGDDVDDDGFTDINTRQKYQQQKEKVKHLKKRLKSFTEFSGLGNNNDDNMIENTKYIEALAELDDVVNTLNKSSPNMPFETIDINPKYTKFFKAYKSKKKRFSNADGLKQFFGAENMQYHEDDSNNNNNDIDIILDNTQQTKRKLQHILKQKRKKLLEHSSTSFQAQLSGTASILNLTQTPFTTSKRHIQTKYNTQPSFTADARLLNDNKPWTNREENRYDNNTNNNPNNNNNLNNMSSNGYISPSQNTKGVYTSTHFKIDRQIIADYLQRKNITFKHTGDKTILMECPVCPKPTYNKPDNMWKCCIFDNGGFVCLRCQCKGSWFDFKAKLGDVPQITNAGGKPIYQRQQQIELNALRQKYGQDAVIGEEDEYFEQGQNTDYVEKQQQQQYSILTQNDIQKMVNSLNDYPNILQYFENERKLKLDTLRKYKVGAHKFKFPTLNPATNQIEWQENDCCVFPWTDRKSMTDSDDVTYTRVKARSITTKANMRLLPKGGPWGFFGWHTVPLEAKTIIITEGELDAMSVYQTTGLPSISLPNGANSLPPTLLPCLERFEKIILWLDDDQAGHGAVETMSAKLGIQRTYHIPGGYGAKDANEALQKNLNIGAIIDTATRQQHKQIQTFSSFRHEVKRMFLDPNTQVGVPYPNMPVLQSLIKGHRRGELTILTGGTGVGKTTLLTQLSLELAMQGVNTLWGSFEIRNPRLVKTLLKQYAACMGVVLNESHHDAFDYVADKFEELPFNFLKFYGSSPVQEVIEAMDYATYVHDVQHVILDNLQFMLSGQGRASGDKFDLQDRAIEAFRQFASQRNVHVTLVIHPRKEQDNSSLGLASVFGSAKATQEADNVMIIQGGLPRTVLRNIQLPGDSKRDQKISQNNRGDLAQNGGFDDPIIGEIMGTYFRTIEIRKNRWDGDLGAVPLRFDKPSSRFYELTNDDIQLGLGDFIAQQKKLRQMDLIKHINHLGQPGSPGSGGGGGNAPPSGLNPPNQQRSGFQNFQTTGGRQQYSKAAYGHNNNQQSSSSPTLSPKQEFDLQQQFERERGDMMNAMLSDGEDAIDFKDEMRSNVIQDYETINQQMMTITEEENNEQTTIINTQDSDNDNKKATTPNLGLHASPQAFALKNMKDKMHNDLEQSMHKTGISSGNLQNHQKFQQMQKMEQKLQQSLGANQQSQFFGANRQKQPTSGNNSPQQPSGPAQGNTMGYQPTLDIIAE